MSPVFSTIVFGPFSTEYHRRAVNDEFREALDTYLSKELLPQVDEPFESTTGSLKAEVNEERFCGPNSLVKDIYILDFAFVRPGSSDQITAQIRRNPKTGLFAPRYKRPLFLWTTKRKEENGAFHKAVEEIVNRAVQGHTENWPCPRCGTTLKVLDSAALVDVSCPRGCFSYNFHRDPVTKEFHHGHFFSGPPRRGA